MLILYLIAALIVLVWAAVFVARGSLVAGCLAATVVAACFGYHFLHFDLGPVPLTLDRLVLPLLAVGYVVQRRTGRVEAKPLGRVEILLILFVGVLTLSTCYGYWRGNPAAPSGTFEPLFRLVTGYMAPLLLFWIARQATSSVRDVTTAQAVLSVLAVYLAVTGLLEVSQQWWAVFPKHIADPEVGLHFGRARGPMVHAVSFGLCLGICTLAAWSWRWRFGRRGYLVLALLMPVSLAALYFTYTRSVWLGMGLAVMVVLGLGLRGQWRVLLLGGMASASLLLAATRMEQLVSFEREQSAAETGKSVDMRASFAYVSWRMFLDRPLCGVGFGGFPATKEPYLADRATSLYLEGIRGWVHHNTFLSILTETGLVGFTLYLAILIGLARIAWQLCRHPDAPAWARSQGTLLLGALVLYACQAAFHELSYSAIDNSLLFVLAGMTTGLHRQFAAAGSTVPAIRSALPPIATFPWGGRARPARF